MELHDLHGLRMLERDECLARLADHQVGRLAVVVGGRPLIFPVNYRVVGDEVLFHTNTGTKFDAATAAPVAFEVDRLDEENRRGWSIVITGDAVEVTDHDSPAVQALRDVEINPWAGPKSRVFRIRPSSISGREVTGGTS